MVQTGITVNQLPDLPAALQMIEEKTGSRPGGTEEKTLCRLLSEELLMHLLRAGYTGIRVSVRNLGSRAVILTAPGEPDTLFTAQPGERAGGDAEETEVEINRNILGEFDGNIDYRYRRKKNIYTIYPGQKDSARITDEILDYYETENGGEKGSFGLLRFLMPLPAVRAVARIARERAVERKEISAFPALPFDLPRRAGPLLLLLLLHELLLAFLAVVRNKVPGRIVGELLSAALAGLLLPGCLLRSFRGLFGFRFFFEQFLQFVDQSHVFFTCILFE